MKALRSKRGNGQRGPDKKPRAKRKTGPPKPPPPGRGRVAGSTIPLPPGAVSAINGLRYRVPPGTPEPLGQLADDAFDAVVGVMKGQHCHGAMAVLGAAKTVREEICGAIAQRHDIRVEEVVEGDTLRHMAQEIAAGNTA